VIFLDRIQVFDKDNLRIGETYPRRAKQLVLNERAAWTDDTHLSIRLADMLSTANAWEDKHMDIKESVEHNEELENAVSVIKESIKASEESSEQSTVSEELGAEELVSTPSEDLLLYLAKQNVARRYDLIRHIILFPVTFIILAIVTSGFRFGSAFYVGFYFAWGLLIAYKIFIVVRIWLMERPKATKVDYVQAEYERLKNTPPEKIRM